MMLANLTGLLADAADAAETYVAQARRAVSGRGGRVLVSASPRPTSKTKFVRGLEWALILSQRRSFSATVTLSS